MNKQIIIELLNSIREHWKDQDLPSIVGDNIDCDNNSVTEYTIDDVIDNAITIIAAVDSGKYINKDAFIKYYCKVNCGERQCIDSMDQCMFIGELLAYKEENS